MYVFICTYTLYTYTGMWIGLHCDDSFPQQAIKTCVIFTWLSQILSQCLQGSSLQTSNLVMLVNLVLLKTGVLLWQ